jgi:hypothetical protein
MGDSLVKRYFANLATFFAHFINPLPRAIPARVSVKATLAPGLGVTVPGSISKSACGCAQRRTPALVSWRTCASTLWPSVDTHAYHKSWIYNALDLCAGKAP